MAVVWVHRAHKAAQRVRVDARRGARVAPHAGQRFHLHDQFPAFKRVDGQDILRAHGNVADLLAGVAALEFTLRRPFDVLAPEWELDHLGKAVARLATTLVAASAKAKTVHRFAFSGHILAAGSVGVDVRRWIALPHRTLVDVQPLVVDLHHRHGYVPKNSVNNAVSSDFL